MSANSKWTAALVPAARGARVVLAVSNVEKVESAATRIAGAAPRADVTVRHLTRVTFPV